MHYCPMHKLQRRSRVDALTAIEGQESVINYIPENEMWLFDFDLIWLKSKRKPY